MVNIEPGAGEDDGDGGNEELALRRMLHGAVDGLEPSLGSLEHLRRAVPARRARKRQAVVGAAAAAVLIGTAVPAFVHVAASEGTTTASPVNAGHGEEAQGGTGTETGVEGGRSAQTPASSASPSPAGGEGAADGSSGKPEAGAGAPGEASGNTQEIAPGTDRCASGQLGAGGAQAGGPDAEGRVYGSFRVVNISGTPCVVDGAGVVGFEARGAADPGRIAVVRHASGGAGGALPGAAREASRLLLEPKGSYEVKFVWVPSETCPTTGTTPTPTPTTPVDPPTTPPPTPAPTEPTGNPEPSGGTGPGGSGGSPEPGPADGGPAAQLVLTDGPADGSVVVSHTAEPGGPSQSAVVPDACSGTVYRTGLLGTS
ncbi:hypothetical protein ACIGW0_08835 [Streptomyces bikiniensis]|uniref:DUF4232 domain-containing protein n=1 Tax=Streptomyces bikiniensis TaxID=1896 RepID=A0ABW8CPJ2_STRBI